MKYYNNKDVAICTMVGIGRFVRWALGLFLVFVGMGSFGAFVLDMSSDGSLVFGIISTVVLAFCFITWRLDRNIKLVKKWNEMNKRR